MHPRSSPKKTRRALVLSAVMIFLGEILAGFLIDRAPLEIRFPDAATIIRAAVHQGRSPDFVFFGGSRFESQFSAEIVQQELAAATSNDLPFVLNAAVPASDPVTFDFLSARLLEAGVRPAAAVIEISPETVSRRTWLLTWHLIRHLTWADVIYFLPDVLYSNAVPRLLSTRLIPVYFFRHEFRQWALEASGLQHPRCCAVDRTEPPQSENPRYAGMTLAERLIVQARENSGRLHRFQIGGFSARALERLLERHQSLAVTTILLGVPLSSPSRVAYVREIDDAFLAYMQKLREKYGVYFFDYRDRVPDELFKAAYYTTEAGTSYVSRLLAREVLAPLWQNRGARTGGFDGDIDVSALNDPKTRHRSQGTDGNVKYEKLKKQ